MWRQELELYAAPAGAPRRDAPKPPATEFGFVKLAERQQKWLIDCLLATTLICAFTGRWCSWCTVAAALFSCMGKGITATT
jgi:hypothetical protein